VLDHLGIPGSNRSAELSRLWWCPAGDLVLLPLHAAGRQDGTGRSVPDLVVSSYTPTLRALLQARTRPAVTRAEARMLVVGMPHTPGAGSLPQALREIELLASRFPQNTLLLIGEDATRASVLDAMAHSSLAHFACHGTTELTDPSTSSLMLTDGPLTVADVLNQRFGTSELAFLSACRTAASGGAYISDEPVHLASALQLAGYRHVIGTLWPVRDTVAAWTAGRFYAALSQYGKDNRHIAHALNDAVQQLRHQYPDQPELWAAYVHIGP
jgi:CHAT domain-containing protein